MGGGSNITVNEFNPKEMKKGRICLMIGKRGTGKSTLIRDIMYHMKGFIDQPLAMTPTEESVGMFEECMPESCVHTSFNPVVLDRLIHHQRQRGKKKLPQRDVLLVLDDMMFDKKVLKGQGVRDIFMNGRHLKITFINAMQYCMDMGPDLRSQVDYCFALRENIVSNRVKLWKYFFGGFENFEDFCSVFTACTSNNECMVIDNTVKSNNISDMIFWYKANINIGSYILGDRKLWYAHYKYYRTDEEMDNYQDTSGDPCDNKKSNRITHVSKTMADGTRYSLKGS